MKFLLSPEETEKSNKNGGWIGWAESARNPGAFVIRNLRTERLQTRREHFSGLRIARWPLVRRQNSRLIDALSGCLSGRFVGVYPRMVGQHL